MKIDITPGEQAMLIGALETQIAATKRNTNTEKDPDIKALREVALAKQKTLQAKIASQELTK